MTDEEKQELKETAATLGKLTTDVAILKHSNEKIIEPTLKRINEKLDRLSFYTKAEIDKKLKEIQKKRWYENSLSAAAGVILAMVVTYFVNLFLGR